MFVERYTLIMPTIEFVEDPGFLAALGEKQRAFDIATDEIASELLRDTSEESQVYRGKKAVGKFGISVQGSGARAKGKIKGTINTYSYEALYEVYRLEDNTSAKYWFIEYKKNKAKDELKKVFENSSTGKLEYDLEFTLQGNDFGLTAIFITYEVIRLELNGQTKDFVVRNPQSAGASTPTGEPYPGEFQPIE